MSTIGIFKHFFMFLNTYPELKREKCIFILAERP